MFLTEITINFSFSLSGKSVQKGIIKNFSSFLDANNMFA